MNPGQPDSKPWLRPLHHSVGKKEQICTTGGFCKSYASKKYETMPNAGVMLLTSKSIEITICLCNSSGMKIMKKTAKLE